MRYVGKGDVPYICMQLSTKASRRERKGLDVETVGCPRRPVLLMVVVGANCKGHPPRRTEVSNVLSGCLSESTVQRVDLQGVVKGTWGAI